jgi:hypothetical protein
MAKGPWGYGLDKTPFSLAIFSRPIYDQGVLVSPAVVRDFERRLGESGLKPKIRFS